MAKTIGQNSLFITLIAYGGAIIGYLNKVFLFTNYLATDQVGLANILVTLSTIFAQIAAMGSQNITLRFFPFFRQEKAAHNGMLFGMAALAMAGFIVLLMLFLMLHKPFVWTFQESSPLLVDYSLYLLPLALAITFQLLFESYLRSLGRHIIPSVVHEVGLRILTTLSILAFALNYISFPAFVAVYVMAHCLPALLLILYTAAIGQLFMKPLRSPLLRRLGKAMIWYGVFSLMNNMGMFLLVGIDSMMVAGMIGLGAAGIYTTMGFLGSAMLIPYRSMVKASSPTVATLWKEKNIKGMDSLYKDTASGSLVVGVLLFALIWVNLDSFFSFMPGVYQQGQMVFLFLGLGKLFDMAAGLNGVILLTSKKYRTDLIFTLSMVAMAFVSNLLLIPPLGMNGAALASLITLVLFNTARILYLWKLFHIQPFRSKQFWILPLLFAIMGAFHHIPAMDHVITDLFFRSILTVILLIAPIYLLNIAPGFNREIKKQFLKNRPF